MSVEVMSEVFKLCLEAHAKAVLLKFADCADDFGGNCYPSILTVGRASGLSRATVQRIVDKLTAQKVMIIVGNAVGGRGKTRKYRLDLKRAFEVYGRLETWEEIEEAKEKGLKLRPFSKVGKGLKNDPKGPQIDPERASELEAQSILKPSDKDARARDPALSGGGATPERSEQEAEDRPPPYNTRWRQASAAMQAAVGDLDWRLWCADLIPLDPAKEADLPDRNGRYHLAARSEFIASALSEQSWCGKLEEALGMSVGVHYRHFAFEVWRLGAALRHSEWPEGLSGGELWLAAESTIAADLGRWWGMYGPYLHPINDDGETFTIGTENRMRFDLMRGKSELNAVAGGLGRIVQLILISEEAA